MGRLTPSAINPASSVWVYPAGVAVKRCQFWLLRPRHSSSSGGSHEAISDGGSVLELSVEVKGT
jgi:hypothetical protein